MKQNTRYREEERQHKKIWQSGRYNIWLIGVIKRKVKYGGAKLVFRKANKDHETTSQNWIMRVSNVSYTLT